MIAFLSLIFVLIVCVEAVTEIVVKSKIFYPIRDFFFRKKNCILKYISGLLSCGHCFSLWASAVIVGCILLTRPNFFPAGKSPIVFILAVLFIHRVSNYLHFCVDRVDKFYK